jgi:hypothetical protein
MSSSLLLPFKLFSFQTLPFSTLLGSLTALTEHILQSGRTSQSLVSKLTTMVGLLALCQGVGLLGGGVVAYLHPRYLNVSQSLPRVDVDFGPGVSTAVLIGTPDLGAQRLNLHAYVPGQDPFSYMVDNTFNTHGVAPDKGMCFMCWSGALGSTSWLQANCPRSCPSLLHTRV